MDAYAAIKNRAEQKRVDYAKYGFDELEMAALNAFFDLAQEYDGLDNLYHVSVTVPAVFFDLQCNLFVIDPKTEEIRLAAGSNPRPAEPPAEVPEHIEITDLPYHRNNSYVVPIHGKRTPASRILFRSTRDIIGIFEVIGADVLSEEQSFFIQKYVNRIGYNMYNKFLAEQNIQHLKFINNLVADIEHNVIVPNIQYKYYFRKIRSCLAENKEIEGELEKCIEELKGLDKDMYAKASRMLEKIVLINRAIFDDQERIEQHYKHTSLFLESLFRPDHFLLGGYILRKVQCLLWEDIILPQLERYRRRFVREGIEINDIERRGKESEDVKIRVDKGLMAQVVANFFSNAVKYTELVTDSSGKKRKKLACEVSRIDKHFGRGQDGVRVDFFTSGRPLSKEDAARVFDEGFRCSDRKSVAGSGHGLHFVKNVVEVHGGVVGHETHELGNRFYFIIPL